MCGAGFVNINMHTGTEFRRDSDNGIFEDKLSVGKSFNRNYLIIDKTKSFRILGSHVNMTERNDCAFVNSNLTVRTYKCYACRAFGVARLSDGRIDSKGKSIAE